MSRLDQAPPSYYNPDAYGRWLLRNVPQYEGVSYDVATDYKGVLNAKPNLPSSDNYLWRERDRRF